MSLFIRHIPCTEAERGDALQNYATRELGVVPTRQRRNTLKRHRRPPPPFRQKMIFTTLWSRVSANPPNHGMHVLRLSDCGSCYHFTTFF